MVDTVGRKGKPKKWKKWHVQVFPSAGYGKVFREIVQQRRGIEGNRYRYRKGRRGDRGKRGTEDSRANKGTKIESVHQGHTKATRMAAEDVRPTPDPQKVQGSSSGTCSYPRHTGSWGYPHASSRRPSWKSSSYNLQSSTVP